VEFHPLSVSQGAPLAGTCPSALVEPGAAEVAHPPIIPSVTSVSSPIAEGSPGPSRFAILGSRLTAECAY